MFKRWEANLITSVSYNMRDNGNVILSQRKMVVAPKTYRDKASWRQEKRRQKYSPGLGMVKEDKARLAPPGR